MRRQVQRVHDSAAYVLHAAPWRETSLIVQAFSREHGSVALVAKGAKRPYSTLRPVLQVFQPLLLSWSGAGGVKTMTCAESLGVHPLPGPALMSAWYMNELLLRLLPREDAHPQLFDAYGNALRSLAAGGAAAGALRCFEWTLLQETGYGLDGPTPDFASVTDEPRLRVVLRERLAGLLEGRALATRNVLLALQRVQGHPAKPVAPRASADSGGLRRCKSSE